MKSAEVRRRRTENSAHLKSAAKAYHMAVEDHDATLMKLRAECEHETRDEWWCKDCGKYMGAVCRSESN